MEIIDLTSSPRPPPTTAPAHSPELLITELAEPTQKSRSRRRKQKQPASAVEEGEVVEAAPEKAAKKPRQKRSRSRSREREPAKESRRDKRRREHQSRDRDRNSPPRSRRSRSPAPRRRERERTPEKPVDDTQLFFIDTKPVPVPENVAAKPSSSSAPAPDLILPAHVAVIGSNAVAIEIPAPNGVEEEENEDDYIDYLDYDDDRRAGVARYFDEATTESKPTKFVCKNCGAEGEHKTRECPVQICLTCGARDEHSTRSCPISKTCYTCGMRGHINRTCPNRYSQNGTSQSHDDCNRCGSRSHYTKECPTLWRIYEFVDDKEREAILHAREEKKDIPLGQGGEGYVAVEDWCYNCGECGHLGDDCAAIPHQPDVPREPSAFSEYNTHSGPFFDPTAELSNKRRARRPRDWEVDGAWADGHGFQPPLEVGRQGRKKERARMEKIAGEQDEEDDEDNWFNNHRNVKARGMTQPGRGKGKVELSIKDAARRFGGGGQQPASKPPSSAPGLLARLGDRIEPRAPSRSGGGRSQGRSDRDRSRNQTRDRYGGRDDYDSRGDRYRDRPRYKGGYA